MEFAEQLRRAIDQGVLPVLTPEDRDKWLEAVSIIAAVSLCLQMRAKDNLIRLMESVFSQANGMKNNE